jgi:hypothetical protein
LADTVAKVESCSATNFRESKKRETIADSYILNRTAEVAGEFNARGPVPRRADEVIE